jgi:Major Facilitator Superfamily
VTRRRHPSAVIAVCALVQLCTGIGFYAVVAHFVVHLCHDLGLPATAIGAVLATRTVVQYTLHLPAGAITDRLGAAITGALSCALRGAGFALLAVATSTPALLAAAILIGAGGSGYLPAGQALLATLPGTGRSADSPGTRPPARYPRWPSAASRRRPTNAAAPRPASERFPIWRSVRAGNPANDPGRPGSHTGAAEYRGA